MKEEQFNQIVIKSFGVFFYNFYDSTGKTLKMIFLSGAPNYVCQLDRLASTDLISRYMRELRLMMLSGMFLMVLW